MEALVATLVVVALAVLAFWLLARAWPATSRLGGYRARSDDARSERGDRAADARPTTSDDGARWRWPDHDDG